MDEKLLEVWKQYQKRFNIPDAYESGTLSIKPEDAVDFTVKLLAKSRLQTIHQIEEWADENKFNGNSEYNEDVGYVVTLSDLTLKLQEMKGNT